MDNTKMWLVTWNYDNGEGYEDNITEGGVVGIFRTFEMAEEITLSCIKIEIEKDWKEGKVSQFKGQDFTTYRVTGIGNNGFDIFRDGVVSTYRIELIELDKKLPAFKMLIGEEC